MEQIKKRIWRRSLFKIFAGLLVFLVAAGLMAFFFPQQVLTVDSGPVKADILMVLGGNHDRAGLRSSLFQGCKGIQNHRQRQG